MADRARLSHIRYDVGNKMTWDNLQYIDSAL